MRAMAERVLTTRELNRALLARQLLLDRSEKSITRAIERMGGLQTQYAPSGYLGLWSRVSDFRRHTLTAAMERHRVFTGTLMRITIHTVSARDYPLFSEGVRASRRKAFLGSPGSELSASEMPRVLYDLADRWVPPSGATEEDGLRHLVRRYLGGFGPAPLADIANWAGVTMTTLRPVVERMRLRRFRAEDGGTLFDVPGAPLPNADTRPPVRFLPTWDATLLAHARRTQVLPEEHRARIFSIKTPHSLCTLLVDGAVAGVWRVDGKRVVVDSFDPLPARVRREVEDEAARLSAWYAPEGG
jgi:hypothetical protein